MKKILVCSSSDEIVKTIRAACNTWKNDFDFELCVNTDQALSFMDYELPEIKVIDFTSTKIDGNKIISAIHADPWFHNGGVICVVPDAKTQEEIEERRDPNILIVQTLYSFRENFTRLLKILITNPNFLFNRGMHERFVGEEKGGFICGNDPIDIKLYTNLLVNYLYCTNRLDEDNRYALQTTLMELLTNALEHGNCAITYDEKTKWLESGKNMLDLIRSKTKDPAIAAKKIRLNYVITSEKSLFSIADEGKGFDWKKHLDAKMTEETHGRGMSLSKNLVTKMVYNEKGNAVKFMIKNQTLKSNSVPSIMIPFSVVSYKKHEVVCRQNEPSNDLYFIVSGRYGVYVNGKLVSVLTPNDMFIGEMAFLLNDRRSATIMSAGEGKLICIPKVAFLNLIRENPHYGIFLSKLLAQRLSRQTKTTISLSTQIEDLKVQGMI